MNWMILPYRRYFQFTGRSRRREYWAFVLFQIVVGVAIGAIFGHTTVTSGSFGSIGGFTNAVTDISTTGGMVSSAFNLVSLIPGLAVSIRRLHDQDRSGWLLLLVLIPVLGWFALLVLMLLDGTHGANRYGADPKNPVDVGVFR